MDVSAKKYTTIEKQRLKEIKEEMLNRKWLKEYSPSVMEAFSVSYQRLEKDHSYTYKREIRPEGLPPKPRVSFPQPCFQK